MKHRRINHGASFEDQTDSRGADKDGYDRFRDPGTFAAGEFNTEAYAPDSETRDKKNLLRYRSSLAAMKVRIKNSIHSVLTRNHIEEHGFTSLSDKFGKQGMAYLRAVTLKDNDTDILNDYLDLWEETEKKIKEAEKRIRAVCREDKICALLQSIPGIGPILAVTIRYEIDDIERFMSAGKLCSSAGLVPSTYSSGNRTYRGKIAARE